MLVLSLSVKQKTKNKSLDFARDGFMKIKIKKLTENAKLPRFSLKGDIGMDIFSNESKVLKPGQRISCKTGIAIKIPRGYGCFVWDKSSLSHKHGLKVLGGVFDSNYTGEYFIGLVNLGLEKYEIKKGHKIAQLVFKKTEEPEVELVEKLGKTSRGAGAFGHTGTE